ncbi:MAG TPA: 50S ribosomal protein L36, partial [Flavobacteriaceae bacterium]|nr:50S ribosomal protein L36 [Flavobacteriaceae bacterium]
MGCLLNFQCTKNKVKQHSKKICRNCKVIKRNGVVRV